MSFNSYKNPKKDTSHILKTLEEVSNEIGKIERIYPENLELLCPSDLKEWASSYATKLKNIIDLCEPKLDKLIKPSYQRGWYD